MANEQQLGNFIDTLLSDLQSGTITTEDALAQASQFEYIRGLFTQEAENLALATAEGDDSLKTMLVSLFTKTKARLAELPAFASQPQDIVRADTELKDTATLERFAFETLRKETDKRSTARKQAKKDFIHTLVTQYSSRVNAPINDAKMETVVNSALSKSLSEQSSQEAQQRFVNEVTKELGIRDAELKTQLETTVSRDTTKTVLGSWRDAKIEREALTTLFTHPDLMRPDVVVDAFVHASDTALLQDVSAQAVKLAQTAGALATLNTAPRVKGPFFSQSNAKGAIKGAQQAADGILSLVGEPLREIILKEKINGTLRSALTSANQLADRLGENFIHSSVFGYITQNILKGANEKPSMSQPTSIFGDVFGSVFRGPLDYATTQGAKENLYDFLQLARANSNAPKGLGFMGPTIMPWHLGSGALSQKKRSALWFPSIGFGALGRLGGGALGNFFDRFVGLVFAGPSLTNQLRASRRAAATPTPISEDLPTLIAIFVISVLLLFFILPTFLNIPQLSVAQKMSALLASLGDGMGGTQEGNPNVEVTTFRCDWSGPPPPPSPISVCPVRASITQGPFSAKGSHSSLNAYDFGASQGTPVLAAHGGYVVSYYNGYAPNQFAENSYGNNVVLIGTNPSTGKTYCTNYAHLLDVTPSVVSRSGKPIPISAGETIGFVDTTGYTYGSVKGVIVKGAGTHLHFGHKGENPREPFLPPGC